MKVLTTEAQRDLQELIGGLADLQTVFSVETKARLKYWSIELKPKRTRKKKNILDTTVEA